MLWYNAAMKKLIRVLMILAVLAAAVFWFFYPLRSLVVMGIYSAQHDNDSVMSRAGVDIDMPSSKGWYPFVMTYNAHSFGAWANVDAQMSIMYNFGAFDLLKRTSTIYDRQSDKYSAFYGAYAVRESGGVFGFAPDGSVDMDEVSLAVEYDYTQLVIAGFGLQNPVFSVDEYTVAQNVDYAGSGGWTRVDAQITANGAAHNYDGYVQPYLQYGRPMESVETDFEETAFYGRVYAKYLEHRDVTVMLYIIGPSEGTVEICDKEVLSKTEIKD